MNLMVNKMKEKLLNIFNVFYLIIFAIVLLLSIFDNNSTLYGHYNCMLLIIVSSLIFCALYLLWKKISSIEIKSKKRLIIFLFGIIILIQLIAGILFMNNPSWDFGVIFGEAIDFTGSYDYSSEYFSYYLNNVPLLAILKTIFSIFHILGYNGNYIIIGMLLNIIMLDLAIYVMYKLVNEKYGFNNGILSIILMGLYSPIYLYVPIFYTDTLSMIFPILLLYLYYLMLNKPNNKVMSILFGIVLYVGMMLKFTVVIIFIAMFIYTIIDKLNKNKSNIKAINILLIIIPICVLIITKSLVYNLCVNNHIDKSKKLPYTHWIAMGLVGNGGYNEEDAEYAKNITPPSVEKEQEIIIIKDRIKEHINNKTFINFIANKIVYVWGDGSYYAPSKLVRSPINNGHHYDYINMNNSKSNLYKYFSTSYNIVILLLGLYSAICCMRCNDEINFISRLSLLGLFFFLLMWEARSRYLVNYLPIIVISSIYGFNNINKFKKFKKSV